MVKLYTLPTCPPCHEIMAWLDQQGIAYTEIPAKGNPFIEMTPTADIDGKFFVGYDAIREKLEQNG